MLIHLFFFVFFNYTLQILHRLLRNAGYVCYFQLEKKEFMLLWLQFPGWQLNVLNIDLCYRRMMWSFVDGFLCFSLISFHFLNAQVYICELIFSFGLIAFLSIFSPSHFWWIPAALNIKGVFNTSNETKYEKEPPDGTSLLHKLGFLNCYSDLFLFTQVPHKC